MYRTFDLKKRASGFTLIELLVVISIIALLIAILLPALSKARQATEYSACMSNLPQLSIAAYTYAVDHDGKYPSRNEPNTHVAPTIWRFGGSADYRHIWEGYVSGYDIDDPGDVFWSPSNPYPAEQNAGRVRWPHGGMVWQTGHAFYPNFRVESNKWAEGQAYTSIDDAKPTSQIWTDLAEDKTLQHGWWRLINHPATGGDSQNEFSEDGPAGVHSALHDGSVQWYNYPNEMEIAAYQHGASVPGDWRGKPGGRSWQDD